MTHAIHLRARGRLALLLAIPVLVSVVMWWVAREESRGADLVTHTLLVQLSIERLLSDLKEAETGQRGYLLTGEARYLDPYYAAVVEARRELVTLSSLSASQKSAVARMSPLVNSRLAQLEFTLQLYRAGRFDLAAEKAGIDRGKEVMDSVRSLGDEMRGSEENLLGQRENAFSNTSKLFSWSLVLGYGLIVVAVASLYRDVKRYGLQSAEAEERLSRLNAELDQRVRERTELLAAREELLNSFVKHVPAAVAMLDRDMRYLQVSDRWYADYSLNSSQILGRSYYDVLPDIPERWKQIHRRCLEGETLRAEEDRWERDRRPPAWLRWEIRPWGSRDGLPEGILIFSEDITERKQIETALRDSEHQLRGLAGSLLTAQEDERRRVARELHDDVTQRLAFLAIELGKLAGEIPDSFAETRTRVRALQDQTFRVSNEVRRVSHGLHPSVITDFGLSIALEEFCEEFEKVQGIHVQFDGLVEDSQLDPNSATCLYRIAQESLRNAVIHGRATEIRVELAVGAGAMQLRVSDNGAGFCPDNARTKSGLGVISMRERIRLVNGTFTLSSQVGQGTDIVAAVPLEEVDNATGAHSTG